MHGQSALPSTIGARCSSCLVLLGFGRGFCSKFSTMVHMLIHDAPFYNWSSSWCLLLLGFTIGLCLSMSLVHSWYIMSNWRFLLYVPLLKARLCYVGPFSVLIVLLYSYCYLITSTILVFAQIVFCSVLLYHTWQTRVKETLVEGKDGVYGPHGVHAHFCSREPFFQSFHF